MSEDGGMPRGETMPLEGGAKLVLAKTGGEGNVERRKRPKKDEQANKEAKEGGSKGEGEQGEAGMEKEAQRLKEVGNAAAMQIVQRSQEAKTRAEATLEEPFRARVLEVELQARLGGRDFFKDLVMDGMQGDKITTSWLAQYTAKHGYE